MGSTDTPQGQCLTCEAKQGCPFVDLPAEISRRFHAIGRPKRYGSGQVIIRQGDHISGVFLVRSGWVRLARSTRSGKTATVDLRGPGVLLGLVEVLIGPRSQLDAEAFEDCEAEYVSSSDFRRFLGSHPGAVTELLRGACAELHRTRQVLYDVVDKVPLADRLLQTLRELSAIRGQCTEDGIQLTVPFTGQELADRIGCSRQWVCGLLAALERRGMIDRKGGLIKLTSQALGSDARTSVDRLGARCGKNRPNSDVTV